MLLVDIRYLEEHDRAEGLRNGIISTFRTGEYNTWRLRDVDELRICHPDEAQDRVQGLATKFGNVDGDSNADGPQIFLFDIRALRSLDEFDESADGIIDLDVVVDQGVSNTWIISFGDLAEHSYNLEFQCAGDFDGDGQQDIAVSLYDRDDDVVRAHVILISYRNLLRLDQLDGDQNRRVQISALWQSE